MTALDDRIQSHLAAQVTMAVVEGDVRTGYRFGTPEFEAEIERLNNGNYTLREIAKARSIIGGSRCLVNALGRISDGVIWLMVASKALPELWHVLDYRCPRCHVDVVHQHGEVDFRCAICGESLDSFERIFDESEAAG